MLFDPCYAASSVNQSLSVRVWALETLGPIKTPEISSMSAVVEETSLNVTVIHENVTVAGTMMCIAIPVNSLPWRTDSDPMYVREKVLSDRLDDMWTAISTPLVISHTEHKVELSPLIPSTRYEVVCFVRNDEGGISLPQRIMSTTACCHDISLSLKSHAVRAGLFVPDMIKVEISSRPQFNETLSLHFNVTTLPIPEERGVEFFHPSPLSFPISFYPGRSYSKIVALMSPTDAVHHLNVWLSGSAAQDYRVRWSDGTSASYASKEIIANSSRRVEVPPPPTNISARFSWDGMQLLVDFSSPFEPTLAMTELGDVLQCNHLFRTDGNRSDLALATCRYTSDKRSIIMERTSLLPNDVLIFRPGRVYSACPLCFDEQFKDLQSNIEIRMYIDPPLGGGMVPDVALKVLPDVFGGCSQLSLELTSTSGSGGRDWKHFELTVREGDSTRNIAGPNHTLSLRTHSYATLHPSLFSKDGLYTIELDVTNFLGVHARVTRQVTRVFDSMRRPIASIHGIASRTIRPSDELTLTGTAYTDDCSVDERTGEVVQVLNYEGISSQWVITEEGSEVAISFSSLSQDALTLWLQGYFFEAGKAYSVSLQSTVSDGEMSSTSKASIIVSVSRLGLHSSIAGGSRIFVKQNDSAVLDGSRSADRDVSSGINPSMTYKWSCHRLEPTISSSVCGVMLGNVTDGSRLTVFARDSDVPTVSQITLAVADAAEPDRETDSASVIVEVIPGSVPVTKILSIVPIEKVNHNNPLLLEGECDGVGDTEATWLVSPILADSSMAISPYNVKFVGKASFSFLFTPGAMHQDVEYTFSLLCSNHGLFSETSVKVQVNSAPAPGIFVVEPFSGTELMTSFSLAANLWVDSDIPLMYAFGQNTPLDRVMLRHKSSLPRSAHMFSLSSNAGTVEVVTVFVNIYDSLGAQNTATTNIDLMALDNSSRFSMISDLAYATNTSHGSGSMTIDVNMTALEAQSKKELVMTLGNSLGDAAHKESICSSSISDGKCLSQLMTFQRSCGAACTKNGICESLSAHSNAPLEKGKSCKATDAPTCYMSCSCNSGYTGPDCENQVNVSIAKLKVRSQLMRVFFSASRLDDPLGDVIDARVSAVSSVMSVRNDFGDTSLGAIIAGLSNDDQEIIKSTFALCLEFMRETLDLLEANTEDYVPERILDKFGTVTASLVKLIEGESEKARARYILLRILAMRAGYVVPNGANSDSTSNLMSVSTSAFDHLSTSRIVHLQYNNFEQNLLADRGRIPYLAGYEIPQVINSSLTLSIASVPSDLFDNTTYHVTVPVLFALDASDGICDSRRPVYIDVVMSHTILTDFEPIEVTVECNKKRDKGHAYNITVDCGHELLNVTCAGDRHEEVTVICGTQTIHVDKCVSPSAYAANVSSSQDLTAQACHVSRAGIHDRETHCRCNICDLLDTNVSFDDDKILRRLRGVKRKTTFDIAAVGSVVFGEVKTATRQIRNEPLNFEGSIIVLSFFISVVFVVLLFMGLSEVNLRRKMAGATMKKQILFEEMKASIALLDQRGRSKVRQSLILSLTKRNDAIDDDEKAFAKLVSAAKLQTQKYLRSFFPGSFGSHPLSHKFMREISRRHHLLMLFSTTDWFNRLCIALTLLSHICFSAVIISICLVVQYPRDTGVCKGYDTRDDCLYQISIFNTAERECVWEEVSGSAGKCSWQYPAWSAASLAAILVVVCVVAFPFHIILDLVEHRILSAPTREGVNDLVNNTSQVERMLMKAASGNPDDQQRGKSIIRNSIVAIGKTLGFANKIRGPGNSASVEEGSQSRLFLKPPIEFDLELRMLCTIYESMLGRSRLRDDLNLERRIIRAWSRRREALSEYWRSADVTIPMIGGVSLCSADTVDFSNFEAYFTPRRIHPSLNWSRLMKYADDRTDLVNLTKLLETFEHDALQYRNSLRHPSDVIMFDAMWGLNDLRQELNDVPSGVVVRDGSFCPTKIGKAYSIYKQHISSLKEDVEHFAGLKLLKLFVMDLLGGDSLRSTAFNRRHSIEYAEVPAVSQTLKVSVVMLLVIINTVCIVFCLSMASVNDFDWQLYWLSAVLLRLLIALIISPLSEALLLDYTLAASIESDIAKVKAVVFENGSRVIDAKRCYHLNSFSATDYVFGSVMLAKELPHLFESKIILMFRDALPDRIIQERNVADWHLSEASFKARKYKKVMTFILYRFLESFYTVLLIFASSNIFVQKAVAYVIPGSLFAILGGVMIVIGPATFAITIGSLIAVFFFGTPAGHLILRYIFPERYESDKLSANDADILVSDEHRRNFLFEYEKGFRNLQNGKVSDDSLPIHGNISSFRDAQETTDRFGKGVVPLDLKEFRGGYKVARNTLGHSSSSSVIPLEFRSNGCLYDSSGISDSVSIDSEDELCLITPNHNFPEEPDGDDMPTIVRTFDQQSRKDASIHEDRQLRKVFPVERAKPERSNVSMKTNSPPKSPLGTDIAKMRPKSSQEPTIRKKKTQKLVSDAVFRKSEKNKIMKTVSEDESQSKNPKSKSKAKTGPKINMKLKMHKRKKNKKGGKSRTRKVFRDTETGKVTEQKTKKTSTKNTKK